GGHGITDRASPPNAFNANGAGATWSYLLDNKTILVNSNSTWMYFKGLSEASTPPDAWRALAFDDSSWASSAMPFSYGDAAYTNTTPGTFVGDMANNAYSSIYLRTKFNVASVGAVSNLYINSQSDDGFIAWINGVEVQRYNMPGGDIPFSGGALNAVNEPTQNGAAYILHITNSASLVNGINELAVHAFNVV